MRFFRPLLQAAATVKKTTGLHGYPVHPDPKPALTSLYTRILHSLQRLPDASVYKRSTETLVKQRMAIVQSTDDVALIEKQIGAGQVEELIEQAEAELKLIPKIEQWKAWEPLEETPVAGQWNSFARSS